MHLLHASLQLSFTHSLICYLPTTDDSVVRKQGKSTTSLNREQVCVWVCECATYTPTSTNFTECTQQLWAVQTMIQVLSSWDNSWPISMQFGSVVVHAEEWGSHVCEPSIWSSIERCCVGSCSYTESVNTTIVKLFKSDWNFIDI